MANQLLLSAIGDSEVVNTATETTIFSGTVPGGTLGTDTLLILRMLGDYLNNSGAGTTFTIRAKFGGTTIGSWTSPSQTSTGDRHADLTTLFLGAENATNAQRSYFEHKQSGAALEGEFANGNDHNNCTNHTIAINSTVDQTLAITVQHSAAASTISFRRRGVWVEHYAAGEGSGDDLLLFDQTSFSYNNSVVDTTVASITIPGGTIGTGGLLVIKFLADVLNNSGSTAEWRYKVYVNSNLTFDADNGVANPTSATKYAFPLELWIGGHGSTSEQVAGFHANPSTSNAGSGEGTVNQGWQAANSRTTMTVDSTADMEIELVNVFDIASTNLQYNYHGAFAVIQK